MSVRARFAPSPTGYLHIGGVRTALFNWLFARNRGGEFLLRIENTDTSREVATATDQIKESLMWFGLDWDGEVTFQLDRAARCVEEGRRLVEQGDAYEDEGAIRIRMPDEGVTAWDDIVRGRVEVPNKEIEDLVAIRANGRPTYNFASPVEDWLDGITHVIRASDHISNTPKQIRILEALGAPVPQYAHVGMVLGPDGKRLSKRHGAQSTDEFRAMGYLPEALVNYLALLGWSFDDRTEIMTRDELVERFSLERVGASPAIFDYEKLDHFNGKYIRALSVDELADRLVAWLREQGSDWDEEVVCATPPLVQEKIERLDQYPDFVRFLFEDVEVQDPELLDPEVLRAADDALAALDDWRAETIEQALRAMADELGAKPRQAFQPVRVAVTGSRISPGLFESLELLGKERSLERIRSAAAAVA
jgi:glutamyl-tRNA synthetase